jgi:hypothetical protein
LSRDEKGPLLLYRCYFTKRGQIVAAENLDASGLSEAIAAGYTILEEQLATDGPDGFEIWQDRSLLYKIEA